MIPPSIEPPPLAVIAHDKLSFHVYFKFSRLRPNVEVVQPHLSPSIVNLFGGSAFGAEVLVGWCVSLLF
jgi:hypothetical protein